MVTASGHDPGGDLYFARQGLVRWARGMDLVMNTKPGVHLRRWLAGRNLEDLDLFEIEVLCASAAKHYMKEIPNIDHRGKRINSAPDPAPFEPYLDQSGRDIGEKSG